jgi:uncharacterized membrane protein
MTDTPAVPTLFRNWIFPLRFVLFLAVFPVATIVLLAYASRWSQAMLGGFDLAALVFIGSLISLLRDHTPEAMIAHAQANDTRRLAVLVITSMVMLVIVTAVTVELPDARKDQGLMHVVSLLVVLISLLIAWLFSNLVWMLHYAHMYYRDSADIGGLRFPRPKQGEDDCDHCPDYWDFIYFSLTMGMAFATSDVEIERGDIRRIAVIHCSVAFFYNLVVLAFTINVTAGG